MPFLINHYEYNYPTVSSVKSPTKSIRAPHYSCFTKRLITSHRHCSQPHNVFNVEKQGDLVCEIMCLLN